jgi:hypothetical protein
MAIIVVTEWGKNKTWHHVTENDWRRKYIYQKKYTESGESQNSDEIKSGKEKSVFQARF